MEPVVIPLADLAKDLPDTPEDEIPPQDDKYIVFKKPDFYQMLGYLLSEASLAGTSYVMPSALDEVEKQYLKDAVVIRRQDYFASPALATYASMIGMANILATDPEMKERLTRVADYFQRQSEVAGDEAWKFPD